MKIDLKILRGLLVNIQSNNSVEFIIELWAYYSNEYHFIDSKIVKPFRYYKFQDLPSNNIQIKVFTFNIGVHLLELLTTEIYNHYNKNIFLDFNSDVYSDHLEWLKMSKELMLKYASEVTVRSKYFNRLPNIGVKITKVVPTDTDLLSTFDAYFQIRKDEVRNQFVKKTNQINGLSNIGESFDDNLFQQDFFHNVKPRYLFNKVIYK
jgi:hypothetical protein